MGYSPVLGRWMEQDPLRYSDGANLYQFLGSHVVKYVDPQGLTFSQKPAPSPRPIVLPAGKSSGLEGLAFAQWTVQIPKGTARYLFQWGTYALADAHDLTGIGTISRKGIDTAPGEQPGKAEYYFDIGSPMNVWLLNLQIGATGKNYNGDLDRNYEGKEWFIAENDGKSSFGWVSASLEVRSKCIDVQSEPMSQMPNLDQPSYNNANRIFFDGGMIELPLAGNGTQKPPKWENAKQHFYAHVDVSWYRGAYQINWYLNNDGKESYDTLTGQL